MVNEQNYVKELFFLKIFLFISPSNRLEKRKVKSSRLGKDAVAIVQVSVNACLIHISVNFSNVVF